MVEYQNKYYYTCTEIANLFHENNDSIIELKKKFCTVYNRGLGEFLSDSYIQSKIYPARDNKAIRFLKYRKEGGKKIYYGFSIDDIMDFLSNPLAKNIQQKKWCDMEISEVEYGNKNSE